MLCYHLGLIFWRESIRKFDCSANHPRESGGTLRSRDRLMLGFCCSVGAIARSCDK